ncbi:DUF3302 domain-containing protein [Eleftheria terrae]|uniref:DUF3302 domain-containing protein n=1 Tax=Eleftheria terrae TaxID=1597781 RepID=UPI00263B914A|nr:DUF3302 domain-containing protein [Eleftheria terrae]WKB55544.1 DUF3302 domain-containing protein [Eleftheria terrae]
MLLPSWAHASLLQGETLDRVADAAAWVVLVVAPVVVIGLFWMVHILPEKIAEKRRHPQVKAIQALCLLSLVFGGWLWPLAMVWATARPVLPARRDDDGAAPSPLPPPPSDGDPAVGEHGALHARLTGQAEQFEQQLARLRAHLRRLEQEDAAAADKPGPAAQAQWRPDDAAAGMPAIDRKG